MKQEAKPTLAAMVSSLTSNRASAGTKVKKASKNKKGDNADTADTPSSKRGRPKKDDGNENKKEKVKREWKQTALRNGWFEFRKQYAEAHKNDGVSPQQLMKDAGKA